LRLELHKAVVVQGHSPKVSAAHKQVRIGSMKFSAVVPALTGAMLVIKMILVLIPAWLK
jgi:hypothetical protein